MKLRLSKIDKIILASGVLLLVIIIVYSQFFSLNPLNSDLTSKEQSLQTEQKLLDTVTQKNATTASSEPEDTAERQKKVPVEPLQEQFILDLQKAETVSNSNIKSMSFSKDVDVTVSTDQTNTQTTTTGQTSTQNATTNQTSTATQSGTTQGTTNQTTSSQSGTLQQATAAYSGMKKLTVQLSVESDTYQDFEKFIETIESLQRIVSVEAINYTGGQEVTTLTTTETPKFTYTLTVSTFYMPSLTDLKSDLPKMDAPAPAGKDNPLTQFPATSTTQP